MRNFAVSFRVSFRLKGIYLIQYRQIFSNKKLNKVNLSEHTFAAMDIKQHLTPLEAWDDFYLNFKCDGKTPNEIVLAEYTRRGGLITGKTKNLGERRIKRLLDKYAPGRYQFNEAHFTKCYKTLDK